MHRRSLLVTLLIAAGLVAPTAVRAHPSSAHKSTFPITVVDDRGAHVRISALPRRIITLYPRDTETLFALGLEHRIVGDGSQYDEGAISITDAKGNPRSFKYPSEWPVELGRDYPIRARSKIITHVEGGFSGKPFSLEVIESLHPDLIVWPYTPKDPKEDLYPKLRSLGLTVLDVEPKSIKGVLHDIMLLGKATGAVAQARGLTGIMQRQVKAVKAKLAGVKTRPRVYYELDGSIPGSYYTAGPGTYIDESISLAKAKNIAHGAATDYPKLGSEDVVAGNPQIIVYSIYERVFSKIDAAAIKSRTGWNAISAVQKNKVYEFNDDLLSRGGPRTAIGVAAIAKLIHPEAFRKHR